MYYTLSMRKIFIFCLLLVICIIFTSCADFAALFDLEEDTDERSYVVPDSSDSLSVHFIDVGQADCILIRLPEDRVVMIDAGSNGAAGTILSYLEAQNIHRIDYLIGTHPHEDHIGSLDSVIDARDIGKIYMPRVENNTKTFEDVLTAIQNKGLRVSTPVAGEFIVNEPEKGLTVQILAPNNERYSNLNNYSIVVRVEYYNTSFLFTGDAEELSEGEMLEKGLNLSADVLKVGHHGSNTSTSDAFLEAVNPLYAIIPCGTGNRYGHPDGETLDKLADITVFRLDQTGTVVAVSDGNTINFE